jgi:hypothetical protein
MQSSLYSGDNLISIFVVVDHFSSYAIISVQVIEIHTQLLYSSTVWISGFCVSAFANVASYPQGDFHDERTSSRGEGAEK